ncbi:hypothetical protein GBW32_23895 [Streptomyces tsukubensis]|nr:hypothetical protein GBW32_23895 [Streptomyces tsukubensis]
MATVTETGIPPLQFVLPEGFHELPVSASPDQRDSAVDGFVRELFPQGDAALREAAAPYYTRVTETMAGVGLAYAGLGIFGTDGPGVAHCSLTVTAFGSDHTDPETAARGTLAALRRDPLDDVRWLDLPCGPSVTCVTLREHTIAAEGTTPVEEQPKLLTGQIQVHIPFPRAPHIAVLTLNTASLEYWTEFCNMITAVLRTVTFPAEGDA